MNKISRQGRHGEALFAALCQSTDARVDAVLNPSKDDEHGWDHVVDLAPPSNNDLPADLQDHLFQCFAQIKTTCGTGAKTRVKLSNAIKAVKSPNPSFIFLFHHLPGTSVPTLYGKHLWRSEIERFLKRAREVSVERHKRPLFEVELSISFSDNDRVEGHVSDWMLARVEHSGGANYSTNKLSIIKSVGYGEYTHEANFSFPSSATIQDIVSHELGVLESLPVVNFSISDLRFDIPSPAGLPTGNGRIEITSEGRAVTIRLIDEAQGRTFDIPARLRVPELVPPDHPDFRFRVDAGCLDIIVHPAKATLSTNHLLDPNQQAPFLQKAGLTCFLSWRASADLKFEVHNDEGRLFGGNFPCQPEVASWVHAHAEVAAHLCDMLGPDKCRDIQTTHAAFHRNVEDMYLAAKIATAGSFRFDAETTSELDDFTHLLGYSYTRIGEWSAGAFYQLEHKARGQDGPRTSYYFSFPKISKCFAYKRPATDFQDFIRTEFRKYAEEFGGSTATVMGGDLKALSKSIGTENEITIEVT